jgi:phospholipase/carboxylesterase
VIGGIEGPRHPPANGGKPQKLVIFAHGYGSNGEDLIGLAPYFAKALPDAMFVSPNAPEPVPGYAGGYQWFPLSRLDPHTTAAGARGAATHLDRFIDAQLARYDLQPSACALVGFSQGTMMALHVGPRRARTLAGIVGYSGMLADPQALAAEVVTKPPVLLVHGDADPTLPVAALHQAKAALEPLGFEVATHVSPGLGHSIDEAGLRLGAEFLVRRLG